VDFETTETQIVCDDNGRIEKSCRAPATMRTADRRSHAGGQRLQRSRFHRPERPARPVPRARQAFAEKQEILRNYLKAMGVA
jgi:hypothetical protein